MKRGAEFLGGSVNPRWRIRSEKWSLASAGLRKFNGEGCGEGEGYGEFSGRTRGFAARHRSQRCRVYSSWKNVCELDGNKLKVRPEVRRQIRPEQFVALRPSNFRQPRTDVDAFIVGGRRVGRSDDRALIAGMGSPPIGNPPIAPRKKRKQSRVKDCFEGWSS